MAMNDLTERYAAMHLIASNSSLKQELAGDNPSKDRVEAYLERVGIQSPQILEVVEAIRTKPAGDRRKIAEVADMLHSAFFAIYPDVCPPDDYAPQMVAAWKNLDAANGSYPKIG